MIVAKETHNSGQKFCNMLIGTPNAHRGAQHADPMMGRRYRDGGVIEIVSLLCLEAFVRSCARHAAF